jgi:uncharacterized membrane protein YgcG
MKKALWIRLKQYRFENLVPPSLTDRVKGAFGSTDAFTRAFAAKVAKKHGWSNEFAFLAVREYKKFVFLGVTSHYEVTPSAIIDAVWHEHQLFTRGYREFCTNTLRRHFDHSPELIASNSQTEVFSAQYLKTLAYYEHEFGTVPPPEIWGKPKFNPSSVAGLVKKPTKKRESDSGGAASSDSGIPIHLMFEPDSTYAPVPVFVSGKGGDFGGGGATSSWDSGPKSEATETSATSSSTNCSSGSSCSSSSCGGGGD